MSGRVDRILLCTLMACGFARPAPLLHAAPETQPAAKPEDPRLVAARQQREAARNQYAQLKELGTMPRDSLVQTTLANGQLRVEVTPRATAEMMRVKVEGSNAVWVVSKTPPPTVVANKLLRASRGPTHSLRLIDADVKSDDAFYQLIVSSNEQYTSISGTRVTGRVTLHQSNTNLVTLSVMETVEGRIKNVLSARAPTIQQLRAEHPEAFRLHAQPMLSRISDLAWLRPGAADVYLAFSSIGPDADIMARLAELLPELDSPAFPIREAASARLDALGPQGVLAAVRLDPSNITDEQRGRLAAFVRNHRRRDLEPAVAVKDPHFLVDALEYEDPAVRKAARERLEHLLGRPVTVDLELGGEPLLIATDALRKEIAVLPPPATQPATQPIR